MSYNVILGIPYYVLLALSYTRFTMFYLRPISYVMYSSYYVLFTS